MRRAFSLLAYLASWIFVCGLCPVLLLALVNFVYLWATGVGTSGFPLRGTGAPTPSFSAQAATNALDHVAVSVVYLGLPVVAVGVIVGIIVAFVRWSRV